MALLGLLLTSSFAILFESQAVRAENDEVDYSTGVPAQTDYDYRRLALSQEDLPVAIGGNDKFEIVDLSDQIPPDGTFTMDEHTFNGLQRFYETKMIHFAKVKITDYRDEKLLGWWDGMELYMADPADRTEAGSRAFVFRDVESATSFWKAYVDSVYCKAMSETSLPQYTSHVDPETYGEESCASISYVHPAGAAGGNLLKLALIMEVTEPKDFNGKSMEMRAWFRVKSVVASLYLEWFEDVPLKFRGWGLYKGSDLFTVSFEGEDPNAKDAGQLTARKWSQRLQTEIIDPSAGLAIDAKIKTEYEQGEAVVIEGQVLYEKKPVVPHNQIVTGSLRVPDHPVEKNEQVFSILTDASGHFSIIPFAPWNRGEYTLTLACKMKNPSGEGFVETQREFKFRAVKPAAVADLEPLKRRYEETIKWGPIWKIKEYVDAHHGLNDPAWDVYLDLSTLPESMYGSYHNLFISKTQWDPGANFVCGGYQTQVLNFMDSVRFNPDPEVRKLLAGWDFGPIYRGSWLAFGHKSVAVYPIGTFDYSATQLTLGVGVKWWTDEFKVFDPWPQQKPMVVSMGEFGHKTLMGTPMIWPYPDDKVGYADPGKNWSGYPIAGAVIYTNWQAITSKGAQPPQPSSAKVSAQVNCPVGVLVTDSQGKRVGLLADGQFVDEFAADVDWAADENGETLGWYFGLPEGVYTMTITGQSTGTFHVFSKDMNNADVLRYGEHSIEKDAQATVTIGTGQEAPLTLPNGEMVSPTKSNLEETLTTTATTSVQTTNESITWIQTSTDTDTITTTTNDNGGGDYVWFGLVLVMLVVAAALYAKRRGSIARSRVPSAAATVTVPAPAAAGEARTYCENCGKPIRAGSTFCPVCGDQQGV